jgi:hypothetical protein
VHLPLLTEPRESLPAMPAVLILATVAIFGRQLPND